MPEHSCNTVKIVNEDAEQGFIIINEDDLTENDTVFEEPEVKALSKAAVKKLKKTLTDAGVEVADDASDEELQNAVNALED